MNHFLFFCLVAISASGAELASTLMPPTSTVSAGSAIQLDLVSMNPGGVEVPFKAPSPLLAQLETANGSWSVELEGATSAPLTVAAGGFAVRHYRLPLPSKVRGRAVLSVEHPELGSLRAVLEVGDGAAELHQPLSTPLAKIASTTPAAASLARNFAGRFLPNQPVYFIYGDGDQAAKFQFSFDYRLATVSRREGVRPEVGTLRVGYTQRSVWDLDGASSPFYDTSYMPELAYSSDRAMPTEVSRAFTWLGWRLALQHESNGKEADESRSLNTLYFRPRFVLGTLGSWAFVMLPELQVYLGESDENPDIDDYRGYGKLRFYFGHNSGPTLMFTGWTGKDFDRATFQLDLAVPIHLRWLNLESYIYAQYFNGYGESLRSYRHRSDALRVGFGLVR
jgi:outer membrane phospholipase A